MFIYTQISFSVASTITVGPQGNYTKVSEAILASSPGDEILIESGEYLDDTVTLSHGDITIRGIGPSRPVLRTLENIPNRKGIFAIPVGAGPVVVEGLHFEGARISDTDGGNAAGIRMQGTSLVVRDCVFTDNQMGILAGGTDGFSVDIRNSEFSHNGRDGSGYEHNVYIGTDQCSEFIFMGNYSHHAATGHQVKSRCQRNIIAYNRLMDEWTGNSSYIIDLPEGGRSLIYGNLIEQGPMTENSSAIISYGAEGTNDDMTAIIVHNTIVNDKDTSATAFIRMNRGETVYLRNNLFIGLGTPILAEDSNTVIDEQGSLQVESQFTNEIVVNRANFNYHIPSASPAENTGVELGILAEESIEVLEQYEHPVQIVPRWDDNAPDIGAYGIGNPPTDNTDTAVSDTADTTDTDEPTENTLPQKDRGCFQGNSIFSLWPLWIAVVCVRKRKL